MAASNRFCTSANSRTSSAVVVQRAWGFRCHVPVPLHGASSNTPSNFVRIGSRSPARAAEYAAAFSCAKAGSYQAVLDDPGHAVDGLGRAVVVVHEGLDAPEHLAVGVAEVLGDAGLDIEREQVGGVLAGEMQLVPDAEEEIVAALEVAELVAPDLAGDGLWKRGFKLGDIVCIDGEWYECIRETHQNKGGRAMYEYEFIRVDTPKVTAAILGWKSKPKDDPDEPTVFQSAIDDDDDADDEGWMV